MSDALQLYPFLAGPAAPAVPLDVVLADVRRSTLEKCQDTIALRRALLDECEESLIHAAVAMAAAFRRGGKLLAFGNGGSATDAQDAAADCLVPPLPQWRALPAIALVNDVAVLTAVANDVGYEHVFARQLIAYGRAGDIALAISTSGNSPSVVLALREAKRRGLLTVALSGADGGEVARAGIADFGFIARLDYTPRIQEGQATLWHVLLELVQEELLA